MTRAEIEAALARAEKATPGPWLADYEDVLVPDPNGQGGYSELSRRWQDRPQVERDAVFAAAARADVPALAAEALRLRDAIEGALLALNRQAELSRAHGWPAEHLDAARKALVAAIKETP